MVTDKTLHRYFLNAANERPHFRCLVEFLFRDSERVDTDGDSYDATSRTWTWLSVRKDDDESFGVEIYPARESPLVFAVESKSKMIAARTAYFLAKSMRCEVSTRLDGPPLDWKTLEVAMGDTFDFEEAMSRVVRLKSS